MRFFKRGCIYFVIFHIFSITAEAEEINILRADNPSQTAPFEKALETACKCKVNLIKAGSPVPENSIIVGYAHLRTLFKSGFKKHYVLLGSISPYLFDGAENVNAVVNYPAPHDVVKIMQELTPKRKIALPFAYATSDEYMRLFRVTFEDANFDVFPIVGVDPSGIFVRMKQLVDQIQIIFLISDPVIISPESYAYLLRFAHSNGMLVVAPSSSFYRLGGDVLFTPDYLKAARKALKLLTQLKNGETGIIEYMPVKSCTLKDTAKLNSSACR